ncbi:hypothetical protein Y032_0052g2177 [Ancylostoma ceylanicum]|uniref:Uncharacterized protein n=1 Tax=Ancylostoma ceylanicum TaxID=53326 RepID=A0A016U895_9BILA|nr:hypothetical protein Y032_0052g2177 [Ancylostoma ceylanicum]
MLCQLRHLKQPHQIFTSGGQRRPRAKNRLIEVLQEHPLTSYLKNDSVDSSDGLRQLNVVLLKAENATSYSSRTQLTVRRFKKRLI